MFNSGMMESLGKTIKIENISFPVFSAVCQYLYTGEVNLDPKDEELSLEGLIEFLSVSDEYLLDEVIMVFMLYDI